MSLKIIRQGLFDSIQDNGRYGYQHLGINPNGAMDRYAMQCANILVGNDRAAPVIEMHFPAAVFLFKRPALIAISGADFQPGINGEPVPIDHPVFVEKNSILQFHRVVSGARAYLAIRGGLVIEKWLNSYSTNLKAGVGGFKGRQLMKDDELQLGPAKDIYALRNGDDHKVLPWSPVIREETAGEVFFLQGHEWDRLATEARENFMMTYFLVTHHSDRMAYHLQNISLPVISSAEILSSAVSTGTLQLLPGGRLVLLMADHQTTGGYPRIAHVITAHHTILAQLKPGDKIKFVRTDMQTAEELLFRQELQLLQMQHACQFRLTEMLQ